MQQGEPANVTVQLSPQVQWTRAKHGSFFVLKSDTYVGRSLVEYGEWTEGEIDLILQILRPGDHVLDVGANIGSHSIPMAKRVAPNGLVHSFEPQPTLFQLLAANVVTNGLENVRLFNAAVGEKSGAIPMPDIDYGKQSNFGSVSVERLTEAVNKSQSTQSHREMPVVTVDGVFKRRQLRLMKIDVEGMEAAVLKGAEGTISRCRPVLYVENEFADRSPELLSILQEFGYDCYWHIAACFRPGNFRNRSDDIFGNIACINVLGLPRETGQNVKGLAKITNVEDHPRKTRAARHMEKA